MYIRQPSPQIWMPTFRRSKLQWLIVHPSSLPRPADECKCRRNVGIQICRDGWRTVDKFSVLKNVFRLYFKELLCSVILKASIYVTINCPTRVCTSLGHFFTPEWFNRLKCENAPVDYFKCYFYWHLPSRAELLSSVCPFVVDFFRDST